MVNYVSFYTISLECMSAPSLLTDTLLLGVFLYMSHYYNDKPIRDPLLHLPYTSKPFYSHYQKNGLWYMCNSMVNIYNRMNLNKVNHSISYLKYRLISDI